MKGAIQDEQERQSAHIWRSDTLRRLCPRGRAIHTTGAMAEAQQKFEASISNESNSSAHNFLCGAARFMVDRSSLEQAVVSVAKMYKAAAQLAFDVWTQRTDMRFVGLHELDHQDRVFDISNPRQSPHSLVRYENHDGELKGRPIQVVVHPLVDVYGNSQGENYDRRITWVPAEVWVDSASKQ